MDALLGLLLLAVYVTAIVGLAAVVTLVAIKIFPTKKDYSKKDEDQKPPTDPGGPAGRLFRKAKRGIS